MPRSKKTKRKTNGRVTTKDAWTAFRNRKSDSSDGSRGSSSRGSSRVNSQEQDDSDVEELVTLFKNSDIDGPTAEQLLLGLRGNNAPPIVSPVGSSSPVGSNSVVHYKKIGKLEEYNKSIYNFCNIVCKFPLEMSRLFKKNVTPEQCKKIFIGAMENLLSGFTLLYQVIGTVINYKYIIMAIFAILYSFDFTRPFVKYMLKILLGWIYFGMEKTGLNNQIAIFIEFVKEKTRQLFQLIMIEYATPAMTEMTTKAVNSVLSNPAFQSNVAHTTQSAMEVALTSPSVHLLVENSVLSAIHSPSGQLAITGAVTGAIANEAIPAIKQHFQLVNVQLHKVSASLTGMRVQMDKNSVNFINGLKEMDLQNIDSNKRLHEHIERQTQKIINNNNMFNALSSLPQITNAASVALESIMGRNVQGYHMLKNEGGRQTRRRKK